MKCGTNAGYIAHAFAKEEACQPCKTAHAAYGRELRNKRYLRRVDRLTVDPTPTVRRLQALAAIGWSWPVLNVRLGYSTTSQYISKMLVAKAVHIDTEAKVKALYEQLHMRPGPSMLARIRAERKGWAPPLAWDDIEDLHERPTGLGQGNAFYIATGLCGGQLHPASNMKQAPNGKRYCPECRDAANARRRAVRQQKKEMAA